MTAVPIYYHLQFVRRDGVFNFTMQQEPHRLLMEHANIVVQQHGEQLQSSFLKDRGALMQTDVLHTQAEVMAWLNQIRADEKAPPRAYPNGAKRD